MYLFLDYILLPGSNLDVFSSNYSYKVESGIDNYSIILVY